MSSKTSDLGLVDGLVQLSFLIQSTLAQLAGEYGVSIVQTRLIGILRDREATMQELANYLELEKSSVTGLVDRAEQKDLVKRISDQDDRRSIRVTLTPRGQSLANKVRKQMATEVDRITSSLSESQQKQLSLLASRIIGSI